MDRHLVAVEVGVEGVADQRVKLDRLTLDQDRLEGLNAQAVKRRRPVQEDRMLADDLFEEIPNLRPLALDQLLRHLDGVGDALGVEPGIDERLEQLQRHLLRQAALMQLQLRSDHDDRAARIIDALAEEVLPKPALLALEHVGQRLEGPLVGAGDDAAAAAVVEQGVDGFLQHALLVADDDVRRAELDQPLQTVVAVDDPAIEIVQVRGREPAAVQRHQRAQLGRDDRDHGHDHPFRPVGGLDEGLDDLQPLDDLLGLQLRSRLGELDAQGITLGFEIDGLQHLTDRLGADTGREGVLAVFVLSPVIVLF